jgi:hypothetical protein
MSPCSGEVLSRTTQSGSRFVGTDSWGGGATAIRVKRVPVSLAPRLKDAAWEQTVTSAPRTKVSGEEQKTNKETGVGRVVRVDERVLAFDDDAGLCALSQCCCKYGERCERTVLADGCEPLLELPTRPADEGDRLEDLDGLRCVHNAL